MRLAPVSVALFASVAFAGCGGASIPGGAALPAIHHRTSSSLPIQHVIIVIQENRSFDDLFATFPNADGTTTGQGEPMPKSEASTCAKDNQQVVTQSNPTVTLTKVSLVGVGFPKFKNGGGKLVSFGEGTDLPHVYGWYDARSPFLDRVRQRQDGRLRLGGLGSERQRLDALHLSRTST